MRVTLDKPDLRLPRFVFEPTIGGSIAALVSRYVDPWSLEWYTHFFVGCLISILLGIAERKRKERISQLAADIFPKG